MAFKRSAVRSRLAPPIFLNENNILDKAAFWGGFFCGKCVNIFNGYRNTPKRCVLSARSAPWRSWSKMAKNPLFRITGRGRMANPTSWSLLADIAIINQWLARFVQNFRVRPRFAASGGRMCPSSEWRPHWKDGLVGRYGAGVRACEKNSPLIR